MRVDNVAELNATGNSGARIVVLLTFQNGIVGLSTQIGSSYSSGSRTYILENSKVTRSK